MKPGRYTVRYLISLVLGIIAVSTVYPVYFLIINSLRENTGGYVFIRLKEVYWQNYSAIFEAFDVPRYMFNTAFVTIIPIVLLLLFSTMGAFSLSKYVFKGRKIILSGFVSALMIPWSILMVPVYLFMSKLHLINNFLSLILFYTASSIPFAIYLLERYMRSIPNELIESVRIDGAGISKIYWNIIVPLSKPAIITILVLHFIFFWNEFLFAFLMLQKTEIRTLTVAVATIAGRYSTNMPLIMAGMLLNTFPIIIIFFCFQQYLQKGLVMGSIK